MFLNIIYGLICIIYCATSTEVPGIGYCPRVNIIQNFDVPRFMGRWYEILAYPNKLTLGGSCVYSVFSFGQNNGISIYSKQNMLGKEKQLLGSGAIVSDGVLGITYPAYPKANAYYNIIDTDYENYAVVFSCNNYCG
ncbi:CLUMA_CG003477, isoform A [Clunio marinus]|uniref:CLUMA_CG003477, isoform A n=1 Tax=Clunio marinus TaxID=568069 RepID=A0A1J1HP78_9DIPT|nr:CLUMA_CG003477, isoform A [Clunio marinus]